MVEMDMMHWEIRLQSKGKSGQSTTGGKLTCKVYFASFPVFFASVQEELS